MKKTIVTTAVLVVILGAVWYLLRETGTISGGKKAERQAANLEKLRALPYISWSPEKADRALTGVTGKTREKAFDGYNLYTDGEKYALLIDMDGRTVHRWELPPEKAVWDYVEHLGNGEILAINDCERLVKLDRDSNVLWSEPYRAHHDIAVFPDGTYLVPVAAPHRLYNWRLVNFDSILRLSPEGKTLGEWSSFSILTELQELHQPLELDDEPEVGAVSGALKRFYCRRIRGLSARIYEIDKWLRAALGLDKYDYYHLNTVEVLPETELGTRDARFAAGNVLICLRHADMILILNRETGDILWSWGPGILDWPHMPTMLENGNILVYDNGAHRDYSRILELDPVTKKVVWEYRADPPERFYSKTRGSNQRLPNGNTLICESERGRVFEVTPEGEVVWEFYNPDIEDEKRRLIYRMMRLPKEEVESWLGPRFPK